MHCKNSCILTIVFILFIDCFYFQLSECILMFLFKNIRYDRSSFSLNSIHVSIFLPFWICVKRCKYWIMFTTYYYCFWMMVSMVTCLYICQITWYSLNFFVTCIVNKNHITYGTTKNVKKNNELKKSINNTYDWKSVDFLKNFYRPVREKW